MRNPLFFSFYCILTTSLIGCKSPETEKTSQPQKTDSTLTQVNTKRVTGVGGIFFKCEDPTKMKAWYEDHLGFKTDEYGGVFEWRKSDDPKEKAYTAWAPFSAKTKYFEPSQKDFMINYRVQDLELLLENLKQEGVQIVGEMETYEYGKFAWIMDPEGNKLELWEPIDTVFTNLYERTSMH